MKKQKADERGQVAGIFAVSLFAAALCCAPTSEGQTPAQPQSATQDAPSAASKDTLHPEFRFLSTTKVSTMEKELNDLAVQGFRVERVSKSALGNELAAIVARDSQAPHARRYEYKMIATRRAETMEKEITEAAREGFELRGLVSLLRIGMAVLVQGDETAVLMERPLGETARRYEYKLLSTRLAKTMQKELNEAMTAGFTPVEIILGQDNGAASLLLGPQLVFTTILGRPANHSGANANASEYKLLKTSRVGSMEREMNQAGKEGYRYYMSSPGLMVLMYRQAGSTGAVPYRYKLLATRKTGTMKKELSEHCALGYRYLATTNGLGGLSMILENEPASQPKPRHEYKLLATSREKTMDKEIADAIASSYQIVDLTNIGEFLIVLVRQGESTSSIPKR